MSTARDLETAGMPHTVMVLFDWACAAAGRSGPSHAFRLVEDALFAGSPHDTGEPVTRNPHTHCVLLVRPSQGSLLMGIAALSSHPQ